MLCHILTDILKYIDSLDVFDRTKAIPFLLLKGHGSRFGLCFLEYVNPPPPYQKRKITAGQYPLELLMLLISGKWQTVRSKMGSTRMRQKQRKPIVIYKKGQLGLPI